MVEYYKDKETKKFDGEEWLPVAGYEKLYAISSFGRIKSFGTTVAYSVFWGRKKKAVINTETILSQKKHNRGYKLICLFKDKTKKYTTIHRLVAIAFIPNPENKRTVNHKNGVKWDNRVENLEWATDEENGLHSFKELGRKAAKTYLGKFGKNHNRSKPVLQYALDGTFVKEWENAPQVTREKGWFTSNINSVCLNRAKTAYGFKWKYK
jgi:hypothetical protein